MGKEQRDTVIVSVARTPVGKNKGSLATLSPAELGAAVIKKVINDVNLSPNAVEEVIWGNLFNSDWGNLARITVLQAGLPITIPGVTVDRQCSSSLNALAFSSSLIHDNVGDVIVVGGVESYSQRPFYIKIPEEAYPDDLKTLIYKTTPPIIGHPTMIQTAENVAKKYGISRVECDTFALASHQKATRAWETGCFDQQIVNIEVPQRKGPPRIVNMDECVRGDASLEAMSKLKPVLGEGGVVTAANSSPRNDAAAAILVMSREKSNDLGLKPLAVVREYAAAGCDPYIMGIGPVHATRKLMDRYGYKLDDFDLIELNEAFAAQSLSCIRELELDMTKVNVYGGAIAIGHPNAASGAILVSRIIYALKQQNKKRGLVTFCIGGGQGFALILENED